VSNVQNGKRVIFEHESAVGRAGLVTHNGVTTLAYRKGRGRAPAINETISVDGQSWRVMSYEDLDALDMHKLGLAPAP
jgi:hypothetical protein